MTTPSEDLLRLYHAGELGADGYPLEWRSGDPRIPEVVRELAGHRCIRCGHPYRTKESTPEWSACDDRCRHGGPLRLVGTAEERPVLLSAADCASLSIVRLRGLAENSYMEYGPVIEAAWRVLTVHHRDGPAERGVALVQVSMIPAFSRAGSSSCSRASSRT